jgi:itaconate CoA-transferase
MYNTQDGKPKRKFRIKRISPTATGLSRRSEATASPRFESHPLSYVNAPAVIAQNDNVVSVNSTIEMDLPGACNSEYVNGHQFTSTGGQLDFVRGAYASKGGMSFIAFQSSIKDGKISKIVPRLSGPVTTPRTDVHYLVTDNAVANLKGLSSTERAHALIGLPDPAFQDELTSGQGIAFDLKLRIFLCPIACA